MNIDITLTKTHFYLTLLGLLLLSGTLFVLAFTPQELGHTGKEIFVEMGGSMITLQEALDAGVIQGSGALLTSHTNCEWTEWQQYGAHCPEGKFLVGLNAGYNTLPLLGIQLYQEQVYCCNLVITTN